VAPPPSKKLHRIHSTILLQRHFPEPISAMSIPPGHTTLWPPSPLPAWAKAALSRRARIPLNLCMGSCRSTASVLPFTQRMRSVYSPADLTDAIRIDFARLI